MHRLHRDPQAPACLQHYRHGRDQWCMQSPTPAERADIRNQLDAMQATRCAYCEAALKEDARHIEHFRQRDRYPQGTFEWSNLFGSCNRDDTCGKHKDQCGAYQHGDLIKPDIEEPDDFLVFDPQGGIHPKAGLSPLAQHRAEETIRIFNLQSGGLPHMRKGAACGYQQYLESWAELALEFPENEWLPIVEQELDLVLAETRHLPFATAIRHTLMRIA